MYTLGHSFIPAPIHAGGLRYHGMAPLICHLCDLGLIEGRAVPQVPVFEAAQLVNYEYPREQIAAALAELPAVG